MILLLKEFCIKILFCIFKVFPINDRKIVISNFCGKGYGDNGKYIAKELLRSETNYDIVWLVDNLDYHFPNGIRKVKRLSLKGIYELSTAKIWIDNRRKPAYVLKRRNQYYIQTWHGNTALKKVEKDATNILPPQYVKSAQKDSKMIDILLSGSAWETQKYREMFWYNGKILEIGYPRQDILVNKDETTILNIKEKMGIDRDTKIMLYVPTFRSGTAATDFSVYSINYERILETLTKRFGGKWCGMIRLHPNVSKNIDLLKIPDYIVDVTAYDDIQELLLISDCVISDYSSTILEAGIAHKIGLLFAVDFDKYTHERSSYFSLEDLPFPLSKSNYELEQAILAFDNGENIQRLHTFFNDVYGVIANGDAAKKVVEIIEKQCCTKDK